MTSRRYIPSQLFRSVVCAPQPIPSRKTKPSSFPYLISFSSISKMNLKDFYDEKSVLLLRGQVAMVSTDGRSAQVWSSRARAGISGIWEEGATL